MDLRERILKGGPPKWFLVGILIVILMFAVVLAVQIRGQIEEINDRNAERMARCDPYTHLCQPDEIDLNTPAPHESFKEPSVKSDP